MSELLEKLLVSQSKNVSIKVLRAVFSHCATVDELIKHITTVSAVDLSNISLTSIEGLDMLSNLQSVSLQNNMISEAPAITFELLPNLEMLNLYNNKLTSLPDLRRTRLVSLNIAYNPIIQFDVALLPETLKQISISGLDVLQASVRARFPQIEFVESPAPAHVEVKTEVTKELEKEKMLRKEPDDDTPSHKAVSKPGQPTPLSARSSAKSSGSKPQLKSQAKAPGKAIQPLKSKPGAVLPPKRQQETRQTEVKEQLDASAAIVSQINSVQDELRHKYQLALDEIMGLKNDAFEQRIQSIIEQSQQRVAQNGWEGVVEEQMRALQQEQLAPLDFAGEEEMSEDENE